ncbi:uncharacterized protein B0T23DRAFT_390786 [Neurospora hispaniola]|uniref:Secreted protein n=1 Tax=Neurospora hispaniola TaxID=588809 RepID=A0AAJ0HY69_9PEZI|nr:hypothetical protein B0T23DRAFT_390786 [Neurospora hispaniola]
MPSFLSQLRLLLLQLLRSAASSKNDEEHAGFPFMLSISMFPFPPVPITYPPPGSHSIFRGRMTNLVRPKMGVHTTPHYTSPQLPSLVYRYRL